MRSEERLYSSRGNALRLRSGARDQRPAFHSFRSSICATPEPVKRTLYVICVLVALSAPACQRTKDSKAGKDDTKEIGAPAGQTSPSPAAGSVQTTQSPAKPAADPSFDEVTIKTIPVAGPIYMLEGRGGNVGVSAGADGVLLVDDQYAPLAPKILAAVRALGKGEPEFIINTHWHPDHTGGNPEFPKTAIVAHENVRKRVSNAQQVRGRTIEPLPAGGWPVVTFQQAVSLHMNGEEIRVVHFPRGHTDGDSIIFFGANNAVHMGDLFVNGRFPFVDLSSGGDPTQYAANVKSVLDQIKDDTKIIPGHGPLASTADMAAFHAMMVECIEIVRAAKKAGKSLADAQKAGLPDKYKRLGTGFVSQDFWIETLYNGVK